MKRCSKCGIVKEVGSFGRHSQAKDGLRHWCKECNNAAKRADYAAHQERYRQYYEDNYEHRSKIKRVWRNQNPDNVKAARNRHLVSKYGITLDEYKVMFDKNDGRCYSCGEIETVIDSRSHKVRCLQVDHCHDTGRVRGLLCTRCNLALGYLLNDPAKIERLLKYARDNC